MENLDLSSRGGGGGGGGGSGMHIEEGVGPVKAEEIKVLIKDGWICVNQRKQHH